MTAMIKAASTAAHIPERLKPFTSDAISMISKAFITSSTIPSTQGAADNGINAKAGRTIILAAHNSNADASSGNMPENDMPLSALPVSHKASAITAQ